MTQDFFQFADSGCVDVHLGSCLDVLKTFPDQTFASCITSPPYFALRDYNMVGQIGLEATLSEYIAALVQVFREVYRVLRDDATLWIIIGDSYANDGKWGGNTSGKAAKQLHGADGTRCRKYTGLPPKSLMGVPWRLAFALQDDGWILRQDCIWQKLNPLPEPVQDRCVKAHEYIFLFAKNQRYYFDYDAIQEPAVGKVSGNVTRKQRPSQATLQRGNQAGSIPWSGSERRNKRSVWTCAVKPIKGHHATFPPELIVPCVLASTSEKGHCVCGKRWKRCGETWTAACGCGVTPLPDVILDPFAGAGTTGLVAAQHHRHATLIELNPEYVEVISNRLGDLVA